MHSCSHRCHEMSQDIWYDIQQSRFSVRKSGGIVKILDAYLIIRWIWNVAIGIFIMSPFSYFLPERAFFPFFLVWRMKMTPDLFVDTLLCFYVLLCLMWIMVVEVKNKVKHSKSSSVGLVIFIKSNVILFERQKLALSFTLYIKMLLWTLTTTINIIGQSCANEFSMGTWWFNLS